MHISVVIPTYNRKDNLELCLTALMGQTRQDFSVVVADDGSTDGTRLLVERFRLQRDLRIGYYFQDHLGYRVSKARNEGVKVAEVAFDPTHILFVDSDVMLNPRAIAHYYALLEKLPEDVVICGRYDWMPPMKLSPERVLQDWEGIRRDWGAFADALRQGRLENIGPEVPRVNGIPFVGGNLAQDPRKPRSWDTCTVPVDPRTITLSGNLLVPLPVLKATGGFDEAIQAQGQDGEFSYNLWSKGYKAVLCGHAYGLHVYHPRDTTITDTVQWTLQYIREKYAHLLEPKGQ